MDETQTLQADFQAFILGQREAADMHQHLAETPGLGRAARLDIYYQAYRLRLREALSEAYSKTHDYLGDDLFYQACAAYIDAHPSGFRNLRWFGNLFPDHLLRQFPDHLQVAELARFEWALGLAFDASDHTILDMADLATISDWENASLRTSSSLQFLDLHWNSVAIWLALNEEQTPPTPESTGQAVTWIVWRKQLQAHFRSVEPAEAQALQQLANGWRFADVCEYAVDHHPHTADAIGGWLQSWVVDEILAA